jgi:hypothetical protein
LPSSFDPHKKYKFVHDCNAAWLTVEQQGQQFRFERS